MIRTSSAWNCTAAPLLFMVIKCRFYPWRPPITLQGRFVRTDFTDGTNG